MDINRFSRWINNTKKDEYKMRVFTTFSGIGSQEMALRNISADHEVVGISEVDKSALIAYSAIHCDEDNFIYPTKELMVEEFNKKNIGYNFSTGKNEIPKNEESIKSLYRAHILSKNQGDIRLIKEDELPDFDLFTYSFPCKNISVAGKQAGLEEGSDTQSSLLWECERIIESKKPSFLMMENVKNLISEAHMPELTKWIKKLNALGYKSYFKVLNATDFGLPQNRERVMMISFINSIKEPYIFPDERGECPPLSSILESYVGEKYFIDPARYAHLNLKSLPNQHRAFCLDAHYYKGISVENYIKRSKRTLIEVGNLDNRIHSNTRVYDSNGVSPTLNSMNGGNRQPKTSIGIKIRRLTPLECWRLMGYSDSDFLKAKKAGLSDTKLYERAGRGIAVNMLEDIFKNMINYKEVYKNAKNLQMEFDW